jgi:alpha-beta hydrolase superfamily lysophospholipase
MTQDRAAGGGTRGTVVLVHGLWLTSRSWEHWIDRYTTAGYRVLAPEWPGMDVEVEALRADPSALNGLGVVEVADHYERFLRTLDVRPILIGHSFGGLIVQILLDRGLGSAAVGLHPAPPKGVLRLPISALRSAFPVLRNPANVRRAVGLTPRQWHFSFTNTLDEQDSLAAYRRYHVPAPGRPLFQAATANLLPRAATKVNFRNPDRAPLLLVAGSADNTVPPAMVRENLARWRRSPARTELKEYPGRSHFTAGSPGWEEVADDVLAWAERHRVTEPAQP